MNTFRTALLEGIFYEDDGKIVTDKGGSVEDLLAVHFVPQLPIDPDKWGGGCCLWQPRPCPAGHHEHPDQILNISVRGVLSHTGGHWHIDQMDGKRVEIPLVLLDGHYGRLAAASIFDVQKIRESMGEFDPDQIESLGTQATELRDVLSKLQEHLKRG